jgi:LysM repeat protein
MIKMKSLVFLVVFVLIATVKPYAQSEIFVHGASPSLHVTHVVAAKENWYSVGRMYNLSPKDIASFNSATIDQPLNIGQTLKIPLNKSNFSQTDARSASEVYIPLYHIVQEKEWMYRISVNHNKVPVENLEKWNNISRDEAKAGMKLIVGFLKVKQGQSALANGPAERNSTSVPANTTAKSTNVITNTSETIPRETPKKEAVSQEAKVTPVSSTVPADFKGGFFRSQFDDTGKSSSGVAGIFKSTSGWNDGKYYALMNNVPVGTIVRVNFPSTNKTIYAKVLGQLPDMRESTGLTIRISDAAASELDAGNTKFTVDVKY